MHIPSSPGRSLLALVVLAATFASGCASSGPASAVLDFYDALEDGRIEDAIELISSDMRGELPPAKLREGLQSVAQQIIKLGGIEEIEVTEEEVTGEVGRVTVRIELGNGEESVDTTRVVREDGNWRLEPEK